MVVDHESYCVESCLSKFLMSHVKNFTRQFLRIPILVPGLSPCPPSEMASLLVQFMVGREELGCFLSVVLLLAMSSKTNWSSLSRGLLCMWKAIEWVYSPVCTRRFYSQPGQPPCA